jgi:ATP-binding cassette subfamily B protein
VLLAIGGHMVQQGTLTVGELVAFFLYLNRFFSPIQLLVQQYNVYQQGQASISKLRSLLETRPNVTEQADATELGPLDGTVTLDDVTFGYDPAEPVIEGITIRIAAGETVAIVGPTGAGKSTIAKLASRFYDPDSGRVAIDGHDLRNVTFESLRRQLGVVPQEPFLFAGSLRDNIAFARPDASREQVAAAAEAVGLDDVVSRLPDGLDSPVHERGSSLSAGERQLIALARTLLAQPRLLILDEATSNLDLQSEARIEAALDRLLKGRTAILIAHRLTTAMKADRVVVIDHGRIVEIGSHDDLIVEGGRYAAMFDHWQSPTGDAVAS